MGADKSAENTPMPQNLPAQIFCPSPKVWDFNDKRLYWASVVRGQKDVASCPDEDNCAFGTDLGQTIAD